MYVEHETREEKGLRNFLIKTFFFYLIWKWFFVFIIFSPSSSRLYNNFFNTRRERAWMSKSQVGSLDDLHWECGKTLSARRYLKSEGTKRELLIKYNNKLFPSSLFLSLHYMIMLFLCEKEALKTFNEDRKICNKNFRFSMK